MQVIFGVIHHFIEGFASGSVIRQFSIRGVHTSVLWVLKRADRERRKLMGTTYGFHHSGS